MVKQLRQVAGVRQVKVIDFKKGIFALTPSRGATLSESAIAGAVRRSGFTLTRVVAPAGRSETAEGDGTKPPGGASLSLPEVNKLLSGPRDAFRRGDYKQALKLARQAVERIDVGSKPHSDQENPATAEVFQFLSLSYLAVGRFADAAEAAHAALHRGPPWDWKRLSSQYGKVDDYTSHLRALEASLKAEPSADKLFLIGYHYLMLGHKAAARRQLSRAAQKNPKDDLVPKLLKSLGP